MSLAASLPSPLYQIPPVPVRRFSVEEYVRLFQTGFLSEQDRVELLDGWITPKVTRNPPHDCCLTQSSAALSSRLPVGWHLRSQCSVLLTSSVPEPDLAIVSGTPASYRTRHPAPADIALVGEVADSSLDHDRDTKGPIYAGAGIPVYWILNVADAALEVYTSPAPGGYQQRQDSALADSVPLVIAGQAVALVPVAELLG